ncbi:MAG: class I SAM-dependent DNA methyltransferase [Candidatus Acidiferrales bacterium]
MARPSVFQSDYADCYNLIYREKNYAGECDALDQAFARFASARPASVLDLGCGTGGHALLLAARGYRVTGVDASEAMLARARRKAESAGAAVRFHCASIEELALGEHFDAAVSLFNVINYLASPEALRAGLARIRAHLLPGGLFLFDFRHGVPAVRSYAPLRFKWFDARPHFLLRVSETELDAAQQLHRTTFTCLVYEGDRLLRRFQETHVLRYLFPGEVEDELREAGLRLLHLCPAFQLDSPPGEEDWNLLAVARAE